MPAAAELQPAAGYDDRWLLLSLASVLAVAVYYLAVWWFTRPPRPRPPDRTPPVDRCLAELERIETDAAAGRLTAREAHQQISGAIRAFAEPRSGLPVRTMTKTALRREGPPALADLVELLYPPEFAAGDVEARVRLTESLARARTLVQTWS
jgi:hypothetical protein